MRRILQLILLAVIAQNIVSHEDCHPSVEITNGITFANDSIEHEGVLYDKESYYYVDDKIFGCICHVKICIPKCCNMDEYSIRGKKCERNDSLSFEPPVYDLNYTLMHIDYHRDVYFMTNFVCGKDYLKVPTYLVPTISNIGVLRNGSLFFNDVNDKDGPEVKESYCLDLFKVPKKDGQLKLNAIVCSKKESTEEKYEKSLIGAGISIVFMILTLFVYAIVPELRQRRGSILIIFFTATMFLGLSSVFGMQLGLTYDFSGRKWCHFFTFSIYYFILAAFFWMNILSYDMWHNLSAVKDLKPKISRTRLSLYCLYAYGMPTLLTLFMVFMQYGPVPSTWIKPNIGERCFLSELRKVLYFNTPMLCICVVNFFFFLFTSLKIARAKKQSSKIINEAKESSSSADEKNNCWIYFKLFLIMGVNWCFEAISSFYQEHSIIWIVTDLFNLLVGLAIFILFICPKSNFPIYKRRYHKIFGGTTSSNCSQITRTTGTSSQRSGARTNFN